MPYKVVKIIDDHHLVVNAGSVNDIKKGQKLVVYSSGEEVIDPDTKESLGTLDTIKCYLEVSDVFVKMCICINAEKIIENANVNMFQSLGALMDLQNSFRRLQKPNFLPVNAEDISGGLLPSTRITIGDLVREA